MVEMFLEIRHHQGKPDITYPVFICDYCGNRINGLRDGCYYWHAEREHQVPYFVHASKECAAGMDRRHGRMASMPLTVFFVYLFRNCEFGDDDLADAVAQANALGH